MLLPQAATDTSLLVTHNKKAADKERALRSFAPMGQGTACPNSLRFQRNRHEPACDA